MSDQKVVLITGASSGVGQATARILSQEGYRVFRISRNPARAESVPSVEMLALDVCGDDSARACSKAIASQAGHLDVLVNDAEVESAGALEEVSIEEAKAQFETNFFGVVRMVKEVLPLMRGQKHGQIINVSSLSGLSPIPFMGMYSASKSPRFRYVIGGEANFVSRSRRFIPEAGFEQAGRSFFALDKNKSNARRF